MKLEYLVLSEERAVRCLSIIQQTSAVAEKSELNENYFIVSAHLDSESDDSAKLLSRIHENITKSEECTVLTDESSAYYDRILFPLINGFERKLRKLLYSASVISAVGDSKIADLESKDFGEIFTMLFRDDDYWKNVKTFVNGSKPGQGSSWKGFAGELHKYLEGETEKPLWDKLLPGKVQLLRERFNDVQNFRNDVMHAHYITRKQYLEIKRLFDNINNQIEEAIDSLAASTIPESYNKDLGDAISYLKSSDDDYIVDHDGNRIVIKL